MTTTTIAKEHNLENTIKELNKAFEMINGTYFEGILEPVIITVNTHSKATVNGWFTPSKVWTNGEKEYHEINLVAHNLKRGKMQVLQTLFHECLHLYNHQMNIKDVSRGNAYHNKRFLATAEKFGFEFLHDAPDSKIGYSMVSFTKTTFDTVDSWDLDDKAFDLTRKAEGGATKAKKKTTWKWTCGCLPKPQTVRTTKPELRAICPDCKQFFTCADDE